MTVGLCEFKGFILKSLTDDIPLEIARLLYSRGFGFLN